MMTDEFDRLKRHFRAETGLAPRPEAKAAGLARAMDRYDEIFSQGSQGKARGSRLTAWVRGFALGSTKMHGLKLSHGLMAGASLAVITLVILNSGLLREAQNLPLSATPDKDVLTVARPKNAGLRDKAENEIDTLAQNAPASAPLPRFDMQPTAERRKMAIDGGASLQKAPASGIVAQSDQVDHYYRDQGRDKFTDIQTNPVK